MRQPVIDSKVDLVLVKLKMYHYRVHIGCAHLEIVFIILSCIKTRKVFQMDACVGQESEDSDESRRSGLNKCISTCRIVANS